MKYLPLILFAIVAILPLLASAQGAATGEKVFNLPEVPLSEPVQNVSVGPYSLIAYYDEMELHFFFEKNQIMLIAFSGDSQTQHRYKASIERMSDHVYRADINGSAWIEVNTATGITVVHEDCISQVFMPALLKPTPP